MDCGLERRRIFQTTEEKEDLLIQLVCGLSPHVNVRPVPSRPDCLIHLQDGQALEARCLKDVKSKP